jgi:hypothetical protein
MRLSQLNRTERELLRASIPVGIDDALLSEGAVSRVLVWRMLKQVWATVAMDVEGENGSRVIPASQVREVAGDHVGDANDQATAKVFHAMSNKDQDRALAEAFPGGRYECGS